MSNPFYTAFNNLMRQNQSTNNIMSLIQQAKQMENNPGQILDILMQKGKINQQQYNELQQYKNNPQQVVYYLMNHGNIGPMNQAQQTAGPYRGQF